MSALKKTMEWIGFRDPAADELEEYDSYDDTYDAPEFPATTTASPVADYDNSVTAFPATPTLKPVRDDKRSIMSVTPRTYNEAKTIGDSFRDGVPVIMNLEAMSEGEARRMVDFASGLIYGLNGSIERITNRVFLLSPESIEIAEGDARSNERGLFNQS